MPSDRHRCDTYQDYYEVHQRRRRVLAGCGAPSTANDCDIGHIAVVEDDPRCSFVIKPGVDPDGERIDWLLAYRKFRLTHQDIYDFVAFWCHGQLKELAGSESAFYSGIANPAKGINWKPDARRGRKGWDTKRLQAFLYFSDTDDVTLLQEIGHHWMAYTRFKYSANVRAVHRDLLLSDCSHWSSYFDNDRSPMDYDDSTLPYGVSVDWEDNGNGTFTRREVGRGQFAYCNLDLYLMGLIPSEEVGKFYFIRNPRGSGRVGVYRGNRVTLTIQNIIWANGKGRPSVDRSPKLFKVAFVLLTKEAGRAAARVRHIDRVRKHFAQIFRKATRGRADLDTRLTP